MDVRNLLELNDVEDMSIRVESVGEDNISLMVVDDFLKNPHAVRDFALFLHYDRPLPGDYWPGVQASASLDRTRIEDFILQRYLGPVLGFDPQGYSFPAVRPGASADQWSSWFLQTRFGAITLPFEEAPWAKNPHVDEFGFIASVLYLSLPEQSHGGTVFCRHRATGIETIPPFVDGLPPRLRDLVKQTRSYRVMTAEFPVQWLEDQGASWAEIETNLNAAERLITSTGFDSVWDAVMEANPPTAGYLTKSNDVWEITRQVDMKFNRLVLYPTWHLHSVSWDPAWFGDDLAERRLTMMNWLNFPIRTTG